MIILDYSGIAIAAVFSQDRPEEITEGLIRHMILNTIRKYNLQFRDEYGELILACDNSSWRKRAFTHYKANRKKSREESPLDWTKFFEYINLVKEEIKTSLPFHVIETPGAEADDIIGELVRMTQDFGGHAPVMIVSSDKDFIQLHRYKNVKQYSPIKREFITVKSPAKHMFEHICRGDVGDGVPNIMSNDDTFVSGSRQTPIRSMMIDFWWASDDLKRDMPADVWRNYQRNIKLIDLDSTPQDIKNEIRVIYNSAAKKTNDKVLNYLIEKRCNMLISSVDEFFIKTK